MVWGGGIASVFQAELNGMVEFVQQAMELLQTVFAMWPDPKDIIDISHPKGWGLAGGG